MTKYFSLLYGDAVHGVPAKKVIPSQEFSKCVSGEEILQKLDEEVVRYRSAVIEEAERLKEEAESKGFEEGLKRWSTQLAFLEQRMGEVHDELKQKLIPIVLQSAKKIVGREIALNENTIADIVLNNLKAISSHKRIIIYCHRQDLEILEKNKKRLREVFETLESLTIQEREDVEQGNCVIESEMGIINVQWDMLWQTLESALRTILKP